jgi:hypothetical protein
MGVVTVVLGYKKDKTDNPKAATVLRTAAPLFSPMPSFLAANV